MPHVIVGIHVTPQPELLEVVEATDAPGFGLGPGQRRQQQRRQDGDDGYDHQQLD